MSHMHLWRLSTASPLVLKGTKNSSLSGKKEKKGGYTDYSKKTLPGDYSKNLLTRGLW